MPNGFVTAADIRDEMMLTYDFTHHPVLPGRPSPFSKYFCSKDFGMIAHAIGENYYADIIRSMSAGLIDHLIDFFSSIEDYERCNLIKAQREAIVMTASEASLQASRAEHEERIHALHYGFDINCRWGNEREDWMEAKKNLKENDSERSERG